MKAAKSVHLWDIRTRNGKGRIAYFTEVPRRQAQVKRSHEENQDKKESKPKRPRTEPSSATKNKEAEEAKEEKKGQQFVAKELKKEERDAGTSFITRQIQDELEEAEGENNLPESERLKRERNCRNMLNEIDINDFLREQRNMSRLAEPTNKPNQVSSQENVGENQEESDVELEYITIHDNLLYKVNKGKVIPKLVSYEVGSKDGEKEEDGAISPQDQVQVITKNMSLMNGLP